MAQGPDQQPPPTGWAGDELTKFFDLARHKQFGTFSQEKIQYANLTTIDACFDRVAKHMDNPKNPIIPMTLYRCHSTYRAACATSMAGQVPETYTLLRSCLDYGGYGFAMFKEPQLVMKWLNRHSSAESKKASIEDFRIAKIRTMIGATDTTLASIFQELYDRAIDFGAHPNEQAVTSSAQISRDARQIRIDVRYLNDGVAVEVGLRSTAQVGVCCLQLFQHAYPEKFLLLGVKERLTDLWQRL